MLGVKIDGARLSPQHLVFEAADLRTPFPPRAVENGAGFLWIEQDRPRTPAVFHRKRIDLAQNAGAAGLGKAVQRDYADMLRANLRLNASGEIARGQDFVEVDGKVRQRERVVFARDAPSHVPQQLIVDMGEPAVLREREPAQPVRPE